MEYKKLDKKAITSWRIGRLISLAVMLLIFAGIAVGLSFWREADPYRWIAYFILGMLTVYKLVGLFLYPQIEYRQWGYYITEDKVDIRHGLFFITNTIIPIIRIQHITVSQGPVNRKLGLYDVELSLASGSFEIECLSKKTADEISENLKAKLYTRLSRREMEEPR